MEILNADIKNVTRLRGPGRVEARVNLLVRYHPALPPKSATVLTSVPTKGSFGHLRDRLTEDAKRMALLLHRSERAAAAPAYAMAAE